MLTEEEIFINEAKMRYTNIQCCSAADFLDDINRFVLLKRLFNVYHNRKKINERLVLNHIIILYNVFDIHATEFLFRKIPEDYHNYLATFLFFLNRLTPRDVDKYQYDKPLLRKLKNL